jgi:Ca2+-binding RTX toxin-like protein
MTLGPTGRWASLLGAWIWFSACSADDVWLPPPSQQPPQAGAPAPADDGFNEIQQRLLEATCTITATQMTIAVAAGETALVAYRVSDGKVTLNALTGTGTPCEIASTAKLKVTALGTDVSAGRSIILDYANGLFMKGTSASLPGITIDFTVGNGSTNAEDTVQVRGTADVDRFTFGAGAGTVRSLNVNAGTTTGFDAFADVTLKSIENLVISTGAGDDVISGNGGLGTGATAYPSATQILAGADNDTITGGAGDDEITGGSGDDVADGMAGNDTFKMGASDDGADTINVTGTNYGSDTVDYSARTAPLTLTLNGTAVSGEGGSTEGDKLSDKIVTILAGAGDDIITIPASSTVNHVIMGGKGDDLLTGGAGGDVFDGEQGDDECVGDQGTMSYASRNVAITATICDPSGNCAADNNDGDRASTHVQYSGTTFTATDDATTNDNLVTIGGLSNMSTAGVSGRKLVLFGFTNASNNVVAGFTVASVTNATTVRVNVMGSTFVETDLALAGGGLSWSLVGPEKDNVTCPNVIGGNAGDTITGDARPNFIRGGNGNDVLTGGDGNDVLRGEAGNDSLFGGPGDDYLNGGDLNDTLTGGDANDVLEGEDGLDTFTCDGANASGGGAGAEPGEVDITVDRDVAGGEPGTNCEF